MPNEKQTPNLPRVLVVDDEVAIQRFLRTMLAPAEFSLHQADNGHGALAAAAAFKPDIILLDLGLPDMDGVEVIKRIREWSQVPIIVLSVREREDDKVQCPRRRRRRLPDQAVRRCGTAGTDHGCPSEGHCNRLPSRCTE